MKSVKIIFILAVIALLVPGPAFAGGKDKDKRPAVSPALLLYPDASSGTALTKHYRDDPLYQKKGRKHFHNGGYVIDAGPFILDIYNQGNGNRDETAEDVQLVVAINDLELFDSALINGYELTRASFTQTPETPRLYSDKKFPRHGAYPAYYAEIPVGSIALGELAPVGVDIKGDPDNLLIHFDAYGRGTRFLCDDDCHGKDGKKGRWKKDDCCEKDRHGRYHDWEKCTQAFDIVNKLSYDVTQVGGSPASPLGIELITNTGGAAEINPGSTLYFTIRATNLSDTLISGAEIQVTVSPSTEDLVIGPPSVWSGVDLSPNEEESYSFGIEALLTATPDANYVVAACITYLGKELCSDVTLTVKEGAVGPPPPTPLTISTTPATPATPATPGTPGAPATPATPATPAAPLAPAPSPSN